VIRPYQPTDLPALLEVWYAASRIAHAFQDDRFFEEEREAIPRDYLPNVDTWVFELEDEVVGFICIFDDEVGGLFVHPKAQGQGIGHALVDWVRRDHPVLEVEVYKENTIGRSFYARYGFREIHAHLYDETGHELLRLRYRN